MSSTSEQHGNKEVKATKECHEWPLIDDQAILDGMMTSISGWNLIEEEGMKKLEKCFTTKNFVVAMDFLVAAGKIAEERGHHPDLHVTGWNKVRVVIYTFSLSGLTENDFNLARSIDEIPVAIKGTAKKA